MSAYIATVVITAAVSVCVSAVLIRNIVRLVIRRVRLYRSINLVELKTHKLIYLIAAAVVGFFIFYCIMQMADAGSPSVAEFRALFGVGRKETNIELTFVLFVMVCAEAFLVLLGISKNAVVDKGVYTPFEMVDWNNVRDYIIDEDKCMLVLTTNRKTFSTLRAITTPFKVAGQDIQKLRFLLNKNKNKFSEPDLSESAKVMQPYPNSAYPVSNYPVSDNNDGNKTV